MSFEQQYSAITDIEKLITEKIGLIILDSAALFYRLGLTQDDSGEDNVATRRELVNQIGILHDREENMVWQSLSQTRFIKM